LEKPKRKKKTIEETTLSVENAQLLRTNNIGRREPKERPIAPRSALDKGKRGKKRKRKKSGASTRIVGALKPFAGSGNGPPSWDSEKKGERSRPC